MNEGGSGHLLFPRCLFDVAVTFLLFGSLTGRGDLLDAARKASQELTRRGYTFQEREIRIYPLTTKESSPSHAAGWRPGIVSLRVSPEGGMPDSTYLRHELMHQASFETCRGTLPLWAEEAQAINFSGEAEGNFASLESDLLSLRERVARVSPLDERSYRALRALVATLGWDTKPCSINQKISSALADPHSLSSEPLSFIIMSVLSGRVLEAQGAAREAAPIGSLMKILYAASVTSTDGALGNELLRSDTDALQRRANVDRDRYQALLPKSLQPSVLHAPARTLLGERGGDGLFPFELSLVEAALSLRLALLLTPDRFVALAEHWRDPEATLAMAPQDILKELRRVQAIAKTGTISSPQGAPLIGHLLVAWPKEKPEYLAIFRRGGVSGPRLAGSLKNDLARAFTRYPPGSGQTRVQLVSLLPATGVHLLNDCEGIEVGERRISRCGTFRVRTEALTPFQERLVRGVIEKSARGFILLTDPETYADGVLEAEADALPPEAEAALRAVAVYNAQHGSGRHSETRSLCDSTHCMVYLGEPKKRPREAAARSPLLTLLTSCALHRGEQWLPFSKGGTERWHRSIEAHVLARMLDEPLVLSIQRERKRDGEVVIHLSYASAAAESVPCELFRSRLKLPSCPDRIEERNGKFYFEGVGQGHGAGLDVEQARLSAEQGMSAESILRAFYCFER